MAAANPQTHLLETLENNIGLAAGIGGSEEIFLTPYLALACSLLYMMASDGEIEAAESSQLQAVLGGDEAVLSYALRYVQSVPVEKFYATAPELLSTKDKWCILTNVCDALLSDGHADRAELALFAQLSQAFGVREAQFEPYFKILALKNDKSVLGRYTGVKEERQPMTPHFALAIALLYMLTADGVIGVQEVGQLEAVIGEFEGLQNAALKYVRSVKLKQFLDEAAALLKTEQKLYILANVCDAMLSDGEVARLEDKLFMSMMTAFGFTEKTFARYLKVLETKNFKPFDTSAFKNRVIHDRVLLEEDAQGVSSGLPDAANQGVWVGATGDAQMSQFIARTMQDNIQSVSDDFGSQSNVVKVGLNATDGFNLQKIQTDASGPHHQVIDIDRPEVNTQAIHADAADVHRETLDPEVRMQNVYEVLQEVGRRLDRFEVDHFQFLEIGRKQKFTDEFVLIDDDASSSNRQLAEASYARMGLDVGVAKTTDAATDKAIDEEVGVVDSERKAVAPALESCTFGEAADSKEDEASDNDAQSKRFASASLLDGSAMWMHRRRGFAYVQLLVAALSIVFAAPIETRTALGRGFAGPLIKAVSTT